MKTDEVSEGLATYQAIGKRDIYQLIQAIRNGLSFQNFQSIAKNIPFSIAEWASYLHLSERTMQRYKTEKLSFDPIQTDKIFQISILYKNGIEIFGSEFKFNTWLATENIALGNVKPKSLLDSTFGIKLLNDTLGRIEHGIFA